MRQRFGPATLTSCILLSKRSNIRHFLATLSLLLIGALAQAAPPHIQAHVAQARLAGAGTFTWFGLKIYDAELWVGDQGYQSGVPFALELRYARKLDGNKIAQASVDQMEKIGAGSAAQRRLWLAEMTSAFPDVQAGDRISASFIPGEGTRFYLNGKALARVPGLEFALAFFGIWLDPATTEPGLRAALLKGAAPK